MNKVRFIVALALGLAIVYLLSSNAFGKMIIGG